MRALFLRTNSKIAIPTWLILFRVLDEQFSPRCVLPTDMNYQTDLADFVQYYRRADFPNECPPLQINLLTQYIETPTEITDLRFL